MKVIVVVDNKWGIGKDNGLLFRLPLDMEFFKEMTTDKTVVMGSNTLKSFPGGKPLKNRTNIVLDASPQECENCITAHSLDELKTILREFDTDNVFIIGGGMFYRTMLPYCSTAYVTKVAEDGGATVFFEDLDKVPNWKLTSETEPRETNGHTITFARYENNDTQDFCGLAVKPEK